MEGVRLGKEEVQGAVGHLQAELNSARDEYRHGRMTEPELRRRIVFIRVSLKRFNQEYRSQFEAAETR